MTLVTFLSIVRAAMTYYHPGVRAKPPHPDAGMACDRAVRPRPFEALGGLRPNLSFALIFCLVMACDLSACAAAEPAASQKTAKGPEDVSESISKEDVAEGIRALKSAADLEEAERQALEEQYGQAARLLESAAASAARIAELQASIDAAEENLLETKQSLDDMAAKKSQWPSEDAELETLQEELKQENAQLDAAKARLSDLEAELVQRVAGRREIPQKINELESQLKGMNERLRSLPAGATDTYAARVERTLLLAKRAATQKTIEALQKELAAYDATKELLPLQQRLEAARIATLQEEVDRWRQLVNRRMEKEAGQQTEQARREAARAEPALQPIAEENQKLAEATEEATQSLVTESTRLKSITEELEEVSKQFERTRERGSRELGFSEAMGLLLRTRRATLPDTGPYRRAIRIREAELRDVQTALFELEDRRAEMANFDQHVKQKISGIRPLAVDISPEELQLAVRELLVKQRNQLDSAINKYADLLDLLVEIDEQQHELIETIEEYEDYIDERVLWIRSANPLTLKDFLLFGEVMRVGSSPDGLRSWLDVAAALKTDFGQHMVIWLLGMLLLSLWIYELNRFRTWVKMWGEMAEQSNLCHMYPTVFASLLTLALAGFWPVLLIFFAWRLHTPLETPDFSKAVATGLAVVAMWLFPAVLLLQLCRPKGLGESHFQWPKGAVRVIRRSLSWLIPTVIPLAFIIGILEGTGIEGWTNSAGRICFIFSWGLIGIFGHLSLRPGGDFFRHLLAARHEGFFYRFRRLWWALSMAIVAGLVLLAILGYYYTSQQLAAKLWYTIVVSLAILVIGAFLGRWIFVARRRLAMQQLRKRLGTQEEVLVSPEGTGITAMASAGEGELDLSSSSAQSQRLVNSFLWLFAAMALYAIWVEMLPALSVLNKIPAIPGAMDVVEYGAGEGSGDAIAIMPRVSLGDLGLALLALVMTMVAARNVPGLLDISIPQRLPLDAGARYAITTLSRYVIVVIGIVVGTSFLGIEWSQIQWLVAAVSVGLGFGLQEIFANFVSGLIILFERPIRIGDIVTVEETTGIVTRIQTRATTVTNWDKQEFIVPNKEFITGRLLNWTRSDKLNRAVISVGVAYGSDTALVTELLHKVAREHPNVLDDPEPLITFDEFGDSSLKFTVRVYLPNYDRRLITIHELNQAIDQAFHGAGVEIPFPQRDVHFRSGWPDFNQILGPREDAQHEAETES